MSVDSALIANLDEDAARLRSELADVEAATVTLATRWAELAEGESTLAEERDAGRVAAVVGDRFGPPAGAVPPAPTGGLAGAPTGGMAGAPTGESTGAVAEPTAGSRGASGGASALGGAGADWGAASTGVVRAAEARGELAALRASLDRGRADVARLDHRMSGLSTRASALGDETERVTAELARLAAAEAEMTTARDGAEAERRVAEAELAAAEAAAREAATGHRAWTARAEALAMAVDEARGRGDTDRLAGVDGVLGPLLDLVDVEPGFEAAFEAAVVEAIGAVVVDGVAASRQLLSDLGTADLGGVLPAGLLPLGALTEMPSPISRHCPGRPLRSLVRSDHPGVERLLRHLLAATVVVDGGWEEAVDLTLAFPDVMAVTKAGDRISTLGWRLGVGAPGATRAALDEARSRVDEHAALAAAADDRLTEAVAALTEATAVATRWAAEASAAAARYRQLDDAATAARGDARRLTADIDEMRAQRDRAAERLGQETARVTELEALLPALEDDEAAGAARVASERAHRLGLQARVEALVALRAELEVRAAGLHDTRSALTRRLAEVEARLAGAAARRQESEARRAGLLATRAGLDRLGPHLDGRLVEVDAALTDSRRRRDAQARALAEGAAALDGLRRRRQTAERQLAELRERTGRVELEAAEARLRLETTEEAVRRELDCEPAEAMVAACPPLAAGTTPAGRVRDLERELRLMGPVNPLALQELEVLQERHAFLTEQLDDIKGSRRELLKIIRAVEGEMSELLTAALADVTEHFAALFETLFPGGQGRLQITNPDHVLECGIELDARPAGKNVRKLSLLSGGERALCALAFLFAVFRSRPSPFYLLDEVEAALDDVNLHRFIDLLHQFRDEAQLVVVTHQKRTMEAADSLYGVTLQPGGSSKVVSERVRARA